VLPYNENYTNLGISLPDFLSLTLREKESNETISMIKETGGQVLAVKCNVSQTEEEVKIKENK
jgi:hypothetical protein